MQIIDPLTWFPDSFLVYALGDSLQIVYYSYSTNNIFILFKWNRENGRGRRRRRRSRRLVSIAESDFSQCNSVADRGASFCRSLTFTVSCLS